MGVNLGKKVFFDYGMKIIFGLCNWIGGKVKFYFISVCYFYMFEYGYKYNGYGIIDDGVG